LPGGAVGDEVDATVATAWKTFLSEAEIAAHAGRRDSVGVAA
jgi:hypothetical protein